MKNYIKKIVGKLIKLFFFDNVDIVCRWTLYFENVETGESRFATYDNLVVTAGKNMIAKRLAGGANDCDITYIAVGTDATAPDIADTTLGTELDRNTLTSIAAAGTAVTVKGFFGAADANGALEEMGLFGEAASATPDSGTLFNHAAISETKSSSETLTISITITIA